MKKRIMNFLIFTVMLFIVLQITTLANDVLRPKHNVATTTTNISVFSKGQAIVNVRYMGYQDITSGAEITLKIEKKNNSFWEDVVSRTYRTDEAYHSNKLADSLSEMGAYRFTVTYTISGSAGEDDIVRVQEERIYDENCPKMPWLRSGEDYNHDCTAEACCKSCYPFIDTSTSAGHISNGDWRTYDEDYHCSICRNSTTSYASCMQILKEKHEFDENGICKVCGYRKLVAFEIVDEENERVTILFITDYQIKTNSTQFLDPYAYETTYSDYMKVENIFTFRHTYRMHIPFEDYEQAKESGLYLYLYPKKCHYQKRFFTTTYYPSLDLESYLEEECP